MDKRKDLEISSKEVTDGLKTDAQKVLDTFWGTPEAVALRGEFQQALKDRAPTAQGSVEHYMAILDIHLATTYGQLDCGQYLDIFEVENKEINSEYKDEFKYAIEGATKLLNLENIAFNQAIVAVAFLAREEIKEAANLPVLPSPWSTTRNEEAGEEHLDLRIRNRTAKEHREAGKFHKGVSDFLIGSHLQRDWGHVSGARKYYDERAVQSAGKYDELKVSMPETRTYDRYNYMGHEGHLSWKTAERDTLRGRKLRTKTNRLPAKNR